MTNTQNPAQADPAGKPAGSTSGRTDQLDEDSQSVAGEEDPGASLDMPAGSAGQSASQPVARPIGVINPGDEAAEGTPGTGEAICRECGGSGRAATGPCPSCRGSGKVTVGLGGA